jgi:hypothetical protein
MKSLKRLTTTANFNPFASSFPSTGFGILNPLFKIVDFRLKIEDFGLWIDSG